MKNAGDARHMKAQKKNKREEETAGTFDVVSLDLAQKRNGASEAEQEVPTGRVHSNQHKHKVVVSHGGILI